MHALGGLARRRQVRVHIAPEVSLDLLMYLPRTDAGALPAFLALNFYGNTSVHPDPEILPSRSWMGEKEEFGIGKQFVADQSFQLRLAL